jgi:hypothetical protein
MHNLRLMLGSMGVRRPRDRSAALANLIFQSVTTTIMDATVTTLALSPTANYRFPR